MPLRVFFSCLLYRHSIPKENFRYIDLGCGQGFNLVCAAALSPDSEFVGVDFMPEHVAHARSLAKACGVSNAVFHEADFVDLALNPFRLGESFDFAVAHGISTWITQPVYLSLFELVGKLLKPGGVFYNSYNTHPGWLSAVPFQHVILHENRRNPGKAAINHAVDLYEKLKAANAAVVALHHGLMARVEKSKELDPAYLTQEYNNEGWSPRWVDESIELLSRFKLSYLGSATLTEASDANLPTQMRELIQAQPDVASRELVRDLCLNQAFRRDLYVKGHVPLAPLHHSRLMRDLKFVVNSFKPRPADSEPYVFLTGAVDLKGGYAAYTAVLEVLERRNGATVATLAEALNRRQEEVVQMLTLLTHGGWVYLSNEPDDAAFRSCNRFNTAIASLARDGASYRYLLSPVIGQALMVSEIDLILFGLVSEGMPTGSLGTKALQNLADLGKSLIQDGSPISDASQARSAMGVHVEQFLRQLPAWEALGITPSQ